MATTPQGHVAAVSWHNCYTTESPDPRANLAGTLALVHAAQAAGADLIELDVKSEAGVLRVDHNDDGGTEGALLADVLADPDLRAGDQLLFLESKETEPDGAYLAALFDLLRANGYPSAGRPVALRAFHQIRANLTLARELLGSPAYASLAGGVRLQELFARREAPTVGGLQELVRRAARDGLHGVEFHYGTPNLFGALAYARGLGLGVNVYTLPAERGEVFVAGRV